MQQPCYLPFHFPNICPGPTMLMSSAAIQAAARTANLDASQNHNTAGDTPSAREQNNTQTPFTRHPVPTSSTLRCRRCCRWLLPLLLLALLLTGTDPHHHTVGGVYRGTCDKQVKQNQGQCLAQSEKHARFVGKRCMRLITCITCALHGVDNGAFRKQSHMHAKCRRRS